MQRQRLMHLKDRFEVAAHFLLKRQSYYFGIKIIVTLLIFWLLIHHSQLKVELFSSIFEKPLFAFAIIGLFYISVLVNSWRWYRLNAVQGIRLSYYHSITPTLVGIAFNNILPGSVGGDVIRCYYVLKKFPEQRSGALLSVFMDRVCGLMGMIVIACIVAWCRLEIFSHDNRLYYLLMVCFSMLFAGITLFGIFMLLPDKIGLSDWLKQRFMHHRWVQPIISILEAMRVYRQSKLVLMECLLVSIVNQLVLLMVILLVNRMMGLPNLSAFDYILALTIGQIANLIPLTPGGVGIGEAAFANIVLMLNPGIIGAYATVFFAFRLLITVAYLPGIVLGIFGLKLLHNQKLGEVPTIIH